MADEIDKEIDAFLANEKQSVDDEINAFLSKEDPSFEEKYLQPIYDVAEPLLKVASIPGKLFSVPGAIGRSTGKFISGQDDPWNPIVEELKSGIFPSPEGNPLADLSMLEGADEPLIDFSSEEFPKASAVLGGMTSPSSLAQTALDIGLGSPSSAKTGKLMNINAKHAASSYRRKMADLYLNSIQKNPDLANALKSSRKWGDIVDFVADNKNLMNPFKKTQALEWLEGPTKYNTDEFGITRASANTGKGFIGQKQSLIDESLSKIKSDRLIDPGQTRHRAYSMIDDALLGDQKTRAQAIIDDAIPQLDFDTNKLSKLKKVDEFPYIDDDLQAKIKAEQLTAEDLIQQRKAQEFSRLQGVSQKIPNPEYRQDLQWLSTLPIVEGDNIYPKNRSNYVTNIDYPDDPDLLGVPGYQKRASQVIDSVEESFRKSDPANIAFYGSDKMKDVLSGKHLAPELIDNPEFLKIKSDVDRKLQVLNYEIDSVRNLRMDDIGNQSKLVGLLKEREKLTKFFNENFDPSLMQYGPNQESAYKAMIQERGMLPAGFATELRQKANKLIDGAKLNAQSNPVEAGALHEAGMALHKAASEAELNVARQYLEPSELTDFMRNKRQQELALGARDLMDKNRLAKGNAGSYVPVGSLDRGLVREALSAIPEYLGPMSADVMDLGSSSVKGVRNLAPYVFPLNNAIQRNEPQQNNRVPQSVKTDFIVQYEIPRSVQEILSQKDLVMAKIQSEVQDPQVLMMAQQMLDGLQKNPESVKPVLGQLANMMPQIFVKDKYNRFDGIVPMDMRPVATEDIKQSDVSPAIKAQKINLLHNRGQLLD